MSCNNLMIVQGGGPTQVLNATLASVVGEAQKLRVFDRVMGACGGTRGVVDGRFADLSRLTEGELSLLRVTPGAALGSSRFRPSEEDMAKILNSLRNLQVKSVLFLGGDGTMQGAARILDYCRESGYELQVIGIPKTIDNDVARTDRCPGYASAARYIAQSTRDLGMDLRSLPQPVTILETMGRSVGWIAAAAVAAKRDDEDAPHLVCIPEVACEVGDFIGAVDSAVTRRGWAVVVASEGIRDSAGRLVYQKADPSQADPLNRPLTGGVGQYLADEVAARLRIRCRCEKPGLLGRSSMLHVSQQDLEDADLAGRAGVQGLLSGRSGEMVSLLPLGRDEEAQYEFVKFEEVAGVERAIPAEWLRSRGDAIPVNRGFLDYVRPLIGDLRSYHPPLAADIQSQGVVEHAKR